jgi:hypothetical protein
MTVRPNDANGQDRKGLSIDNGRRTPSISEDPEA